MKNTLKLTSRYQCSQPSTSSLAPWMSCSTTAKHLLHCRLELCHAETTSALQLEVHLQAATLRTVPQNHGIKQPACQEAERSPDYILDDSCPNNDSEAERFSSVPEKTAGTLMAVIRTWIKPGTTVTSDCWAAYPYLDASYNQSRHWLR